MGCQRSSVGQGMGTWTPAGASKGTQDHRVSSVFLIDWGDDLSAVRASRINMILEA